MTVKFPAGVALWPIEKLRPYENNSRTHSTEQVEQIAASMLEYGFTNPILIDGEQGIIAGHGRLMAANSLGLKEVPVVVIDHLTPEQRRAYIIADNQLALNAGWDEETLRKELESLKESGYDLSLTGFSDDDISRLMPEKVDPKNNGDEDKVPEVHATPVSKPGDLWILGNHRVMCGDSSLIDSVEKLMAGVKADMVFTDPPYGMNYQSNMSNKFEQIKNDDTFLTEWIQVLPIVSQGWVFIWTTWKVLGKWLEITAPIGDLSNVVVWDKGGGGIGDLEKTFATDYEMAMVFHRGAKITGKRIGSVWSIGKDATASYRHPTQKPVALAEMAIENCTNKKDAVLDLFGGSGSTLIACEKMNRKCFTMELDPIYADVIVRRWEEFTHKKAKLEGSDQTFAELEAERTHTFTGKA